MLSFLIPSLLLLTLSLLVLVMSLLLVVLSLLVLSLAVLLSLFCLPIFFYMISTNDPVATHILAFRMRTFKCLRIL